MDTPQRPMLGIGLMIAGMLVVPFLDVCAKVLGQTYPVLEVVWARYFFHFLWLLPLLAWKRMAWWRWPESAGSQGLRGFFLLACTLCFSCRYKVILFLILWRCYLLRH
ncbi:hypothetical protein [Aliamphritea spongicola]|nr:hypothetical protein [Aliamphritea spongicola]